MSPGSYAPEDDTRQLCLITAQSASD